MSEDTFHHLYNINPLEMGPQVHPVLQGTEIRPTPLERKNVKEFVDLF